MKILILGAGQVGSSVARILASESNNDVTVIDHQAVLLNELQSRLDIRTVKGQASHPDVLIRAGGDDADMLIAVTSSDEVNMVACEIAYKLFNTPTKIARIRSTAYTERPDLFGSESGRLAVDVIISPEQEVTEQIRRIIELPGALQVLSFADDRLWLVGVRAQQGGRLVGLPLRELTTHMSGIDTRIAAIYRDGVSIKPEGRTLIEPDDEVFFLSARQHVRQMMSEFRVKDKANRRVIIAGGGNIGMRLANALEDDIRVKIIEHNPSVAKKVSTHLGNTIVLLGDCADEALLLEENIEQTDVFCSVTNDEHVNMLSGMLAKRLGAAKVMALINRSSYLSMIQSNHLIDVTINPQQATIGALLAHVRRGDVVCVYSLRAGAAEAIEAIAHGDVNTSKVVDRRIDDIVWPEGVTLGALVRGNEILMCHHDTTIAAGDHAILFLTNKKRITEVERLFQVSVTFIS